MLEELEDLVALVKPLRHRIQKIGHTGASIRGLRIEPDDTDDSGVTVCYLRKVPSKSEFREPRISRNDENVVLLHQSLLTTPPPMYSMCERTQCPSSNLKCRLSRSQNANQEERKSRHPPP